MVERKTSKDSSVEYDVTLEWVRVVAGRSFVCVVAGRGLDIVVACFGGLLVTDVVALTKGLVVADGY